VLSTRGSVASLADQTGRPPDVPLKNRQAVRSSTVAIGTRARPQVKPYGSQP
jgi:hypothetical protein